MSDDRPLPYKKGDKVYISLVDRDADDPNLEYFQIQLRDDNINYNTPLLVTECYHASNGRFLVDIRHGNHSCGSFTFRFREPKPPVTLDEELFTL